MKTKDCLWHTEQGLC